MEAPLPTLTVTDITATSLLITWAHIPEDEDWNSAVQRASGVTTGAGGEKTPSGGGSSGTGSGISLSVGGLLASIKGTLSYSQPNHTSFSLYITPIYRTVEPMTGGHGANSGQDKAKLGTQEAETTLIMPFVTPNGSHKVDLLDPGESSWLLVV